MKNSKLTKSIVALVALTSLMAGAAFAQDDSLQNVLTDESKEAFAKEKSYSPYAGRNFPTQPLWGDTHVHTAASFDGYGAGAKLGAEEAYRFARGEEVRMSGGMPVRLSRPLDWLVVADHAEMAGIMQELAVSNPKLMTDERNRRWSQLLNEGGDSSWQVIMEIADALGLNDLPPSFTDPELARSVWQRHIAITDKYNDPGVFTAFNGYEWSSVPNGDNMHRVLIFKDSADKAGTIRPFSSIDSEDPEDLWKFMAGYEDKTGGSVLALAHNGNVSSGLMFDIKPYSGGPMTREYAETRARWEPMYEVTQIKGDGEAHPLLSPDDEFADYETWDKANLVMTKRYEKGDVPMMEGNYARSGLKRGLAIEGDVGVNPYKFGMVGSTDTHISLAAVEEENYLGKYENTAPEPERWSHVSVRSSDGKITILGWESAASGYAAVWATENTRESIFDAMKRKEVYATTGSRMTVRFFGGWDFVAEDADNRLPANVGYGKGVPMGGDLYNAPQGKSPTFLVAALRDPYSGNLDRIQIIKGWLDASGETHEKVYDVVWSDDREPSADGKLPPVGNTVNVERATWKNSIGSPELITVWEDPDFDPNEQAFYYARVIEIPTPRWTTYDAARYGIELGDEVPRTTQERAYTSPIWYTP